jgi:DNA-binding transcriptional ArsR family regulator
VNAFGALADPTRAAIVETLADGERTVGEIVARFRLSQPSISRHLRVLREAGLVSVQPDGQRRVYHLDPAPLREIDAWLERYRQLWSGRLDDLERLMDEETPP